MLKSTGSQVKKDNLMYLSSFFLIFTAFVLAVVFRPEAASAGQAVVKGSMVNLRAGPGVGNAIVGSALQGDVLDVLGKQGDWVKVKSNNKTSWIAGWLVDYKEIMDPVAQTFVPGSVLEVTADNVNVREGPGLTAGIIGSASKGDKYTLLSTSGDWRKISLGSSHGWITGQYLKVAVAVDNSKSEKIPDVSKSMYSGTINGSQVNMRSGPGTDFLVLAVAEYGDSFEVLEDSSDWYKIRLNNGHTGWVASWLVKLQSTQETSTMPVVNSSGGLIVPGHSNYVSDSSSIEKVIESITSKSSKENTVIEIYVDEEIINYEVGSLTKPDRLYIDLKGYAPGDVQKNILLDSELAETIRVGWHSKNPDITRIAIELQGRVKYEKSLSTDKKTLIITLKPQPRVSAEGATVILDPGHGGKDPGAVGPAGTREKDVNLEIALVTAEILEAQGVNVILTRTEDVFVELAERPGVAGPEDVDAFVSIHSNASNSSSANGTSTYYLREDIYGFDQDMLQSMYLSQRIQSSLLDTIKRQDRVVLQANFAVLVRSKAPATLVETAFLSNPEEEKLLGSKEFQIKAALAISQGIISFLTGK